MHSLARVGLVIGFGILTAVPAQAGRSITVRVPSYTVPARSDREVCTFVKLPGGHDLAVTGIDLVNLGTDAEVSSHHFIVYAYTGADMAAYEAFEGKVVDSNACIDFGPGDPTNLQFIGGAQTPKARQRYGAGLALEIKATTTGATAGQGKAIGLILNSHWINGSDQDHTARVRLKLTFTNRKHVKKFLKPIFEVLANGFLKVPPGETKTTGWKWGPGLSSPGKLFGGVANPAGPACVQSVTGHMHRRGMLFTADYVDGGGHTTNLYSNRVYNEPGQKVFDPPLLVSTGETIDYTCTHDNGVTTDQKMGCEVEAGTPPGLTPVEVFGHSANFSGAPHACKVDADCTGIGTGHCVPAFLVFGYTSNDDMCILPGYYFDADVTKPAGHECDVN